MKVFGIGLSKTGTTSLDHALRILGYKVTGPNTNLIEGVFKANLNEAVAISKIYDGFQDWPWPSLYEQMDNIYGSEAKFILTVRSTSDQWFESLCKHAMQYRWPFHRHKLIFGYYYPFGRRDEHINFYEQHNKTVIEYFRSKNAIDRLLIINFGDGREWDSLCNFLGCDVPDIPFPHANNRKKQKNRRIRYLVNFLFGNLYRMLIKFRVFR